MSRCLFFFFQAEDGIRDIGVTGVQTCALPILLKEVHDLRDKGFKEVTLLGQNVNSYGLLPNGKRPDDGISFAQLLREVARSVPQMRVRFTTSNPEDMTEDILHVIAEEPNLCNHIHFPAQSGSNSTLKLMNRKYTREDYLSKVEAIRRIIPGCGLTTDVFVRSVEHTSELQSGQYLVCR